MVSQAEIKQALIKGNFSKYELAEAIPDSDPDTINTLCSRMVKVGKLRIVRKGAKRLSIYGLPESEFLKNLDKRELIGHLDFLMTFFESNANVILSNPNNQEFLGNNQERFELITGLINQMISESENQEEEEE